MHHCSDYTGQSDQCAKLDKYFHIIPSFCGSSNLEKDLKFVSNLKSLALLVSEIWSKGIFDDVFTPEVGATWCPKCSQVVFLYNIVSTYML